MGQRDTRSPAINLTQIMLRLFVAVTLPDATVEQLCQIRLPSATSIRRVRPEQMHVTLAFIGLSEPEPIADALQSITLAPFQLDIKGVGDFTGRDGSTVLWAGLDRCQELIQLHGLVTNSLCELGFPSDQRPFSPHITLARTKQRLPSHLLNRFLTQQAQLSLAGVHVNSFGIYSSTLAPHGSTYRCERSFPLLGKTELPPGLATDVTGRS